RTLTRRHTSLRHRLLFFFQAEDGIRDFHVTGVQTCALPISPQGTLVHGRRHHRSHRAEEAFIEVASKESAGVLTRPAVLLQRLRSEERRVGKESGSRG